MDNYVYGITVLLPLTAAILIFQDNPYHALVIRGILGAVAALVYAVFGAADVALTEALVGTMLTVTLSAVAVRSSLVMRLGILKDEMDAADSQQTAQPLETLPPELQSETGLCPIDPFHQLLGDFRLITSKHHLRLEVIPYADVHALSQALVNKDVHTICARREQPLDGDLGISQNLTSENKPYDTVTRIHRLYQILETELASPLTSLVYTPLKSTTELSLAEGSEEH